MSTPIQGNSELLSHAQAAAFLSISPSTLSIWRCTGRYAIPYLKIGRSIRYSKADLALWLEAQRRTSTDSLPAAISQA